MITLNIEESFYIIYPKDIIKIANFIYGKYSENKPEYSYERFEISITTENNTQFDFNEVDESLKTKLEDNLIQSLSIEFSNHDNRILFEVNKFFVDIGGYVKSNDETWAKGTYKELIDMVKTFEPQNRSIYKKKNEILYEFIIPAISGIIIVNSLLIILYFFGFNINNISGYIAIYFIINFIVQITIVIILIKVFQNYYYNLKSLYPKIEFRTGPEHGQIIKKKQKQKKEINKKIIEIIVIPIIIGALFFLLGVFFK